MTQVNATRILSAIRSSMNPPKARDQILDGQHASGATSCKKVIKLWDSFQYSLSRWNDVFISCKMIRPDRRAKVGLHNSIAFWKCALANYWSEKPTIWHDQKLKDVFDDKIVNAFHDFHYEPSLYEIQKKNSTSSKGNLDGGVSRWEKKHAFSCSHIPHIDGFEFFDFDPDTREAWSTFSYFPENIRSGV